MYLLIFEDGSIKKSAKITDENKQSTDLGYLQMIDITDPENPKDFYDGEWIDINFVDET